MTEEELFNNEPGWQVRLPEDQSASLHFPPHQTSQIHLQTNKKNTHKKHLIHTGNGACVNVPTMILCTTQGRIKTVNHLQFLKAINKRALRCCGDRITVVELLDLGPVCFMLNLTDLPLHTHCGLWLT